MTHFIAETSPARSLEILMPIIVVTLAMCIPIVAIIVEHLHKRRKMSLIEKAIEHGIDIKDLSLDEPAQPRPPYRSGMVMLAVGLGLFFADHFADIDLGEFNFFMMVGGLILGLVGLALLINDRMNRGSQSIQ